MYQDPWGECVCAFTVGLVRSLSWPTAPCLAPHPLGVSSVASWCVSSLGPTPNTDSCSPCLRDSAKKVFDPRVPLTLSQAPLESQSRASQRGILADFWNPFWFNGAFLA